MRVLALAAGLATAGSLTAVAVATPAVAAPRVVVTCGSLSAPAPNTHHQTHKAMLNGCTSPKATGGKGVIGTLNTATGGPFSATVTWNHTGTTTISYSVTAATTDEKETNGCPSHTHEFDVSGTVTGGTGAAMKLIPAGSPVSAEICVSGKGVTNEPGSKVKF
jgi:hypothetical protein